MNIETDKQKIPTSVIHEHLEWLEKRIDRNHVIETEDLHDRVFRFDEVKRLPILITMRNDVAHNSRNHGEWPSFSFDQMWNDYGAMLLNELQPVYESILFKDDKVFTLRPNLSQVFIPSYFGGEGVFLPGTEDTMPAVHKPPTREKILSILSNPPDLSDHWTVKMYCRIIEQWRELLQGYPLLSRFVHYSLPDLQGPFNIYFLLRGTEAYIDLYNEPEFVHHVMDGVTRTLSDVTHYLSDFLGEETCGYYWNYKYPGKIRNVDDNSVLVSRELYEKFIDPYNKMLFKSCGGGIHHYCGVGDHIVDKIMETDSLVGINFGNPEMQDWEKVYSIGLKNKVVLLWDKKINPEIFKTYNQGIIMKIIVSDIESGKKAAESFGLEGMNT